MKAIVYRRVSKEDSDTKQGLARQQQQITDYLNNHLEIEVIDNISVDGVSGTEIDKNEKLQKLIDRIPTIDAVILSELDRLVRPKDFTSLTILDEFSKHNTLIITPAKTYDVGNDQDRLFLHLQSGFAGYERSLIEQRMKAGRHRAASEGLKPIGRNPLGYTFNRDKKMYVFTDDIHQVKELIKMFLQNKSRRGIGENLGFSHVAITRVLRNPILYGVSTATIDGKTYQLKAEPLISKKEWDAIQVKLDVSKNRYPGRGGLKIDTLLAGLLFTEKGEKMYHCHDLTINTAHYYSKIQGKYFKYELIENKLIKVLKQQSEKYTSQVYKLRDKNKEDQLKLKKKLLRYETDIDKLERQCKTIRTMYIEEDIGKDEMKKRMSAIEVQKNHLEYERQNTEVILKDQRMYNLYTVYILFQLCELDSIKSFKERRMLLTTCVDKIVWDISKKEITEIEIRPKGINISDYDGVIDDFKKLLSVSYDKDDKLKKFVKSHKLLNNKKISENGTNTYLLQIILSSIFGETYGR